jgi:Protein of unknown function DUF72
MLKSKRNNSACCEAANLWLSDTAPAPEPAPEPPAASPIRDAHDPQILAGTSAFSAAG